MEELHLFRIKPPHKSVILIIKTLHEHFGSGCTDRLIWGAHAVHCANINDFMKSDHRWFYRTSGGPWEEPKPAILFKKKEDLFHTKLLGLLDVG